MQWYYQHGGQQLGPVSFEQLQALAAAGYLLPTDLLWAEGMVTWVEAGTMGGLFAPQFQQPFQQAFDPSMPFQPAAPQPGFPQETFMPQPPDFPQQAGVYPSAAPQPTQPLIPQQPFGAEQPLIPQPPQGAEPQPSPPPASKKADEWYFMKGDSRYGPISTSQLKQRATSGKLKPDDLVWMEGLGDWIPAKKVMGLFSTKPVPGPAPIPKLASKAAPIPIPKHGEKPVIKTGGQPIRKSESPAAPKSGAAPKPKKKESDKKDKTAKDQKEKPKDEKEKGERPKKGKRAKKKTDKAPPESLSAEEAAQRVAQLREQVERLRQAVIAEVLDEANPLDGVKPAQHYRAKRSDLDTQSGEARQRLAVLQEAQAELEPIETSWQDLEGHLSATENDLQETTRQLGQMAFDAWLAGAIPENAVFAQRIEAHQNLMDFEEQRDRLAAKGDAPDAQKQAAAVAERIERERAKIPGLDVQVGKLMIESSDHAGIALEAAGEFYSRTSGLKSQIAELRPQVDQAKSAFDSQRKSVYERITLRESDSLAAEVDRSTKSIDKMEKELQRLDKELPRKLLADDNLPDEGKLVELLEEFEEADDELQVLAPEGGKLLAGIKNLCSAAVGAVGGRFARLGKTGKLVVLGVGAIAVLGVLAVFFWPGGEEEPAPQESQQPAASGTQPTGTPAGRDWEKEAQTLAAGLTLTTSEDQLKERMREVYKLEPAEEQDRKLGRQEGRIIAYQSDGAKIEFYFVRQVPGGRRTLSVILVGGKKFFPGSTPAGAESPAPGAAPPAPGGTTPARGGAKTPTAGTPR